MTAPDQVRVRLDWSQTTSATAHHANQALAQVGSPGSDGLPDGVYITLGSVQPPAILGGDPEAPHIIDELRRTGARVNILGQFHVNRQLLGDLIKILQVTADKYDEAVRAAKAIGEGDGQ